MLRSFSMSWAFLEKLTKGQKKWQYSIMTYESSSLFSLPLYIFPCFSFINNLGDYSHSEILFIDYLIGKNESLITSGACEDEGKWNSCTLL